MLAKTQTKQYHKLHIKKRTYKSVKYLFSVLVWLIIWHFLAMRISKELFLPAPFKVAEVLITKLWVSKEFWLSILFSLKQIGSGFLWGCIIGIVFSVLSYMFELIEIILWFPVRVIQAVPVASFVILILLWLPATKLSVVIPILIVFPMVYHHTLTAIKQTDTQLLEMAKIFRIPIYKQIRYIFIPTVLPQILSTCSLAIGMAWKSGIAAEIIGLVRNSIGNQLYSAKIHFLTSELFAWTFVIVILSVLCEQLMKYLTHLLVHL